MLMWEYLHMNIQLKNKMNSNRVKIVCIVHLVSLLLNRQSDEQPFALEQLRRNFGFEFHFGNTGFGGCTSIEALFRQF